MNPTILTVTQLNYAVRHLLEGEFGDIWLAGEISNFSQPVSGHWYLTLKDQQAQVRCAMFRMKNQRVGFKPQNGMQVLVRASVSLYEARGDYQLILETMQPAGDGLLQQQFEQLKIKLAAEGLFAQEHKQRLPSFVKTVGIITSSSGAALQDILQILRRRDPNLGVVIYPVLVQGREAAQDIAATIRLANQRRECDVLIVGRGGGSLEDLWCFNEEIVARAIFQSQLPIISAVGHETDVTIADFVADLRAPTPSAAAELVSRDQQELARQLFHQFDKANLAFDRVWNDKLNTFHRLKLRLKAQRPTHKLQQQIQQLQQLEQRMQKAVLHKIAQKSQQIQHLEKRLLVQHPQQQLQRQKQQLQRHEISLIQAINRRYQHTEQQWQQLTQRLARIPLPHYFSQCQQRHQQLRQRLNYAMDNKLSQEQQKLKQLCSQLHSLSPLNVLARGYSITQFNETVITSSQQLHIGQTIKTQFADGQVFSEIVQILDKG